MTSDDFIGAAQEILCNSPRSAERYSLTIDWEAFSINDCIEKFEELSKDESWATIDWYNHLYSTLQQKNADYSKKSDAFSNFKLCNTLWVSVEDWIKVRICDKVSRIRNLQTKEPSVVWESLADTYLDLAWYLTILYIYTYRNEWESEKL